MKTCVPIAVLCSCVSLFSVSCGGMFIGGEARYVLELPELPDAWRSMLGSPHWRIEWFDGEGRKRSAVLAGGAGLDVSVPGTFANPVLALPFWPEKGIDHGVFRPAGAIFPFDVSGGRLVLSWRGGIDAAMFLELARAAGSAENAAPHPTRLPWNFNWPRFRLLFEDPALNADVRADPWLVDWPGVAARTVQSGFDRRRLVPEAVVALELPLGHGPWIGTSPFAAPLVFAATPVFPVRPGADTWVSAEGLLRANTEAWIWREF